MKSPYTLRVFEVPAEHELFLFPGQRAAAFLAEGSEEERQTWMQTLDLGVDYTITIHEGAPVRPDTPLL